MTDPILEIMAERERQISTEGCTLENDDRHRKGQLRDAAACYLLIDGTSRGIIANLWPFFRLWWKPSTERRNLVKAAALIVAELERLDRLEMAQNPKTPEIDPPERQYGPAPPLPTKDDDGQISNVIGGVNDGIAGQYQGTDAVTEGPKPKNLRLDTVKRGKKGLGNGGNATDAGPAPGAS